MQILQRLMLASLVAACLSPVLLHAYDNEAQVRARQALEEKMKELNTEQPTTSAPPAVMTKPEATPTKAKKQPPAKAAAKPATQAHETQTAPVVTSQKPEMARPAPTASAPMTAKASSGAPVYSAPPNMSSNETDENLKLQEALRARMMQEQHAKSVATNTSSQANQPWNQEYKARTDQHVAPPKRPVAPTLSPIQAPATGLSAAKQQKLDQLLQLYRADQITPEEYHEQRAKILAQP